MTQMQETGQQTADTAAVEPSLNPESVKWVAEAARAVAAFQVQCADAMERQGATFLNLLLAGAGGALAYAVNLGEKGAALWQQWGMWGAAAWLFAVAGVLLSRVLWTRPIYGPANDPNNLVRAYHMEMTAVLVVDLRQRQKAIEANRARNEAVGRWLNICQALAAATPLVFGVTAALAAY